MLVLLTAEKYSFIMPLNQIQGELKAVRIFRKHIGMSKAFKIPEYLMSLIEMFSTISINVRL